jgi:hypothetical protein
VIGCRWYIIVLNVQAPTQDKIHDMWDSFDEELEHILDTFPKYHIKIFIRRFHCQTRREDILKLKTGNESVHEFVIGNGAEEVKSTTK